MKNWIGYVVAFLLSLFPGIFLVFVGVFADGQMDERLHLLWYVFGTYAVLGFLYGLIAKPGVWQGTLALSLFVIVTLVWYSIGEGNYGLHALFLGATVIGSLIGVVLGTRLFGQRARG